MEEQVVRLRTKGRRPRPFSEQEQAIINRLKEPEVTSQMVRNEFNLTRRGLHGVKIRAKKVGLDVPQVRFGVGKRHVIEKCVACQKILEKQREGHITTVNRLAVVLDRHPITVRSHLTYLKEASLIPLTYASLRSERMAKVSDILRTEDGVKKDVREIGKDLGYANPDTLFANLEKKPEFTELLKTCKDIENV